MASESRLFIALSEALIQRWVTFLDIDPEPWSAQQGQVCQNPPGVLVDQDLAAESHHNEENVAGVHGQKSSLTANF